MIIDKGQLKEEAKSLVDLVLTPGSSMAHKFGEYCFIKVEGNGPHIRFRSEFPGETIKESDVPAVAAVFAELSKRIEAKYAEELKKDVQAEGSPRRR